jgi:hypothetical protein
MTSKKLTLVVFSLLSFFSYAQLTIDAELRPRFEYRHGFNTLFPDDTEPAAFVAQRTRLNTKFVKEKYSFYLSLQDVRVWGDTRQLSENSESFAIHQAWAKINLSNTFAVKLGRQEVIYDDHRIFGNVGWAQQARSHDMALFQYAKNDQRLDLGFAFNQESQNVTGNIYTLGTYKAFQYAWYHNKFGKVKASFLLLNNGLQNVDEEKVRYSQTLGTHLKFNITKSLSATTNFYYQTGKDIEDRDLSAYLAGLDLNYKVSDKLNLGLGGEIQSGNDDGAPTADKNKAFTPFYGTNHKFNGWMDYFYVGNHGNNVGLIDIYAKVNAKFNAKNSLTAFVHNFNAAADLAGDVDKQLGTEVDLVYNYKFSDDIKIAAGYSHMFAADGMEALKNNTDGNTNNWGWIMITIKPQLFTTKK